MSDATLSGNRCAFFGRKKSCLWARSGFKRHVFMILHVFFLQSAQKYINFWILYTHGSSHFYSNGLDTLLAVENFLIVFFPIFHWKHINAENDRVSQDSWEWTSFWRPKVGLINSLIPKMTWRYWWRGQLFCDDTLLKSLDWKAS